ncbi:MAG: hypothetical protein JNM74_12600, partial [Myxococcales bacterium]|nr:hypothetical protein [Myxococcales bacterium]
MNIDYRYASRSDVHTSADATTVGFASNLAREATYFRGLVERPLVLREGLATLSNVVRSDFTYRARDRASFEAYLARRESAFLAQLGARSDEAMEALTRLEARLVELDAARALRRAAFERARRAYIAYAVKSAIEIELLLDPVVSVHPDRLCFEAFSRDSSAYAILSLGYAAFSRIDAFACGTTNVDFSAAMRLHVERLRGYRPTSLVVGPAGVRSTSKELDGGLAVLDERRIALPDDWFSGFSNVHGFLSMGLVGLRIDKVDLHDLIRLLAAKKARTSPRALRFELVPGERVRIVVEPFETVITCAFAYEGDKPAVIRVWGRDRLRTLARALPLARSVEVMLLGTGLPYVVRLDLDGEATLTLALSGWTDNDFVEGEARFDLLTRRAHVDASTLTRVHDAL